MRTYGFYCLGVIIAMPIFILSSLGADTEALINQIEIEFAHDREMFEKKFGKKGSDVSTEEDTSTLTNRNSLACSATGVKNVVTDGSSSDKNSQSGMAKGGRKPRKCIFCKGKGVVTINTNVICDNCDGTGVLVKNVTLKNKSWGGERDGNWYSVPRKQSTNKRSCPKCNRSGKMNVKKEVECQKCKGKGCY